jgi:FAD/FMN-containing dehydrogenase
VIALTHISPIDSLRARLQGDAFTSGDLEFAPASQAWNLSFHQAPAVVVMAEDALDVREAVRFARSQGLGIGVMATGHGTSAPADGGVLINTSRMTGVSVDPVARTARVEAGAKWSHVLPAIAPHGLAGLLGSTSDVGVVGFTMGGGIGWLGRKFGFQAATVREAEVVTADGELIHASAEENQDLFWGLGGGGGNFGIVTALTFGLFPLTHVYGGNLFYPVEQAPEVLELYARWAPMLPEEMSTGVAFLNLPPLPMVPEPLRGKSVIAIRAVFSGAVPEAGALHMHAWHVMGTPIMDTFGVMPYTAMDAISMDPTDPMPGIQYSEMIRELSPATIAALVETEGVGSGSPLIMLELRQLGGAYARTGSSLSAMGTGEAGYILNAVGAIFAPGLDEAIKAHLATLAEALTPAVTGESYLNFLEADYATADRVRASYSAEDWDRLVALKDRYDPQNLFRFNRNIAPSR